MTEEWRPVTANPRYEVSTLGNFRSLFSVAGLRRIPRPVKVAADHQITLGLGKGVPPMRQHAADLACETWHGERPLGCIVGFIDGDRTNLRRENIHWVINPANALPGEEWRSIQGFSRYEVSSYGRVRSFAKDLAGTLMAQKAEKHGYLTTPIVSDQGKVKTKSVHTLVCEAWRGPRPDGFVTRHLDGNAHNNNQENLVWGTPGENKQDQIRHGTWLHGERRPNAILTESEVLEIRASNATRKQLAEKYGVAAGTIKHIRRGAKWKHLL